jgi:hypothetical protein
MAKRKTNAYAVSRLEFYRCLFCGSIQYDHYYAKKLSQDYACFTHCEACRHQLHTIDSPKRCRYCNERLDCLLEGVADVIAYTLGPCNELDAEEIGRMIERSLDESFCG